MSTFLSGNFIILLSLSQSWPSVCAHFDRSILPLLPGRGVFSAGGTGITVVLPPAFCGKLLKAANILCVAPLRKGLRPPWSGVRKGPGAGGFDIRHIKAILGAA